MNTNTSKVLKSLFQYLESYFLLGGLTTCKEGSSEEMRLCLHLCINTYYTYMYIYTCIYMYMCIKQVKWNQIIDNRTYKYFQIFSVILDTSDTCNHVSKSILILLYCVLIITIVFTLLLQKIFQTPNAALNENIFHDLIS